MFADIEGRIVTEADGNATRFLVPTTQTYDLERLCGLRQPAGFADLDKSEYGLLELPAFERYGLTVSER